VEKIIKTPNGLNKNIMASVNYSIAGEKTQALNGTQKLGLTLATFAFFLVLLSWGGLTLNPAGLFLFLTLGGFASGTILYTIGTYKGHTAGIKNTGNFFNSFTNIGALGWIAAIVLTLFYVSLYWFPEYLGLNSKGANTGLVAMFEPLSQLLRKKSADQWFVYGTFYTLAIMFLGIKFIVKYRHNKYHLIRTIVVMFSQLVLAYFIPNILEALNTTEVGYYSTNPINSYPLNYDFFAKSRIDARIADENQPLGMAYLVWGIILFLVVTPIVTYYVGKRWYCSWFCGCGGLAETAGDPFRHLSNKSTKAWKLERWVMHSVMVFVLVMTLAIMYSYFAGKDFKLNFIIKDRFTGMLILLGGLALGFAMFIWFYLKDKSKSRNYLLAAALIIVVLAIVMMTSYALDAKNAFGFSSKGIKKSYGFFVGAIFSGIIGVGFYPLLGNRVWCRFGCPMAGYMGIIQRFKSRFRITTNGGQCISCGNCSTYCEQGIDVRAYAQSGQNIVRASCVGCGVCSAVCPRGVLKLENGPEDERIYDNPIIIGNDSVQMNPNVK
jgi:Pyruvate/2-oxoacid:ferredoxin oxidoreductase delta subunit